MPITEIVTFHGSDALKNDPSGGLSKFTKILAEKVKGSGIISQVWGFRVEEPGVCQGFLDWPTIEHHKKVAPTLETDPELQGVFQTIVEGPPVIIHVPFLPYDGYKKATGAPLTEVIFAKMKDGADLQEFKDSTEDGLDAGRKAEGCLQAAWGFVVEDQKAAVMVFGWESQEAHTKYEGSQTLKDVTARWLKGADIEKLFHIKLQ